jgi:hypothetical protein
MADKLDPEYEYPHVSRALARSIGEFVVAWGILERELDLAFPILLKTDPTLASCISANLGTKAKLVLTHAQPTIYGSETGRLYWQLTRYVARKSHEMILYPTDPDHWRIEGCGVDRDQ